LPATTTGVLPSLSAPTTGCAEVVDKVDWQPTFTGYDEARNAAWSCDGRMIVVHTALWRTQGDGREAVSEAHRVVQAAWRFETTSAVVESSMGLPVTEYVVVHDGAPWVLWSWYAVGTTPTATDFMTKLHEAKNASVFALEPVARFAIGVQAESVDAARRVLQDSADGYWQQFSAAQGGV
jgi:hypothetical protein